MKEEKIVIGERYPLDGILTLPSKGEAPFPTVVLVHGSGAVDMDSKVHRIRPFKDIAEGLAEMGIATIRYHKRTFSYRKQMRKDFPKNLTVHEETIEDAVFATEFLRNDSRINSDKVYIAGHSMGGALAPRIDASGGNFAGIAILAGSPRTLDEIAMKQQDDFLETANGFVRLLLRKQITKIRANFARMHDMTDAEAMDIKVGGGMTCYYFKDFGRKRVREYLHNHEKPMLVMHAEMDLQALVKEDFEAYQDILKDHPDATFKRYAGLNHVFMPTTNTDINKTIKEYKTPANVSEEVINDLAKWVLSHE